jgi:hypothetical protein
MQQFNLSNIKTKRVQLNGIRKNLVKSDCFVLKGWYKFNCRLRSSKRKEPAKQDTQTKVHMSLDTERYERFN